MARSIRSGFPAVGRSARRLPPGTRRRTGAASVAGDEVAGSAPDTRSPRCRWLRRAGEAPAPAPRCRHRSPSWKSLGLPLRPAWRWTSANPRSAPGDSMPGPETMTDNHSAASGRPLGHDTVHGTDAMELRRLVEFVGVPVGEVLLDVIDGAGFDQHQHAAAKTAAHH